MSDFLAVCELAARAGGAELRNWVDRITVQEKGPKDLVTEADFASQQAIREVVLSAFPEHGFLGEERDEAGGKAAEPSAAGGDGADRWIVDPLDGTLNYIRGLPSYAVSVALERGGDLLAGVVFDPLLDECFTAAAGEGAFLNGKRIRSSRCMSLDQALVAVSFSANVPRDSVEVRRFVEVLHAGQSARRSGSAALNLCYVGCAVGRLFCFVGLRLGRSRRRACGSGAGAVVTSIVGCTFDLRQPDLAVAGTANLHVELLQALSRAE